MYLKLSTSRFLCVCPVIDYEFRHIIVKVAVDPQTTLTMLWQNSLSTTGQTHKKLTSNCFYDDKLLNCLLSLADASHKFQIHVSVRILTIKISQWPRTNSCSYRKTRSFVIDTLSEGSPLKNTFDTQSYYKRALGFNSPLPWTSITVSAPSVIRIPASSFPLTRATMVSIWEFDLAK